MGQADRRFAPEMHILIFQHIACEHPGTIRNFMGDDGVLTHTVELDEDEPIPCLDGFDALMVMGGPMDVWQKATHPWLEAEIAVILAASPACTINAMSWGARAFSIQFHVEITPRTVAEWGQVPAYATTLEQALGDGALARLEEDTGKQMARFNDISKQLYTNFMSVVRRA